MENSLLDLINTIGERFEKIYKLKNMTQVDFAVSIGANQSDISKIINGKLTPTYTHIKNVIVTYQINPLWLLLNKGPMSLGSVQINDPDDCSKDMAKSRALKIIENLSLSNKRMSETNHEITQALVEMAKK